MGFSFRPAVRENVGLIIGVIGSTGSGKTFSAMRIAKGMAGEKPFAVIDTENGRAKHYADRFRFDHGDLRAPFGPDAYQEAILAADSAGYPVIVVDSFSHEHAGDGGILDMQEDELQRMAGDDWKKRESCKMAAWVRPKMAHKRMVSKLLQVRAHLILCFRAEEKIEMVKIDGKLSIQPKKSPVGLSGWIPICEKTLPYELTASFLLTADKPGLPQPIKLQEQHRPLVPLDHPLDESAGELLAAWARGGAQPAAPTPTTTQPAGNPPNSPLFEDDRLRIEIKAALAMLPPEKHQLTVEIGTRGRYHSEDELASNGTAAELKTALEKILTMVPKKQRA